MAASAATKAEIEEASRRANDGSKPVLTEKRPYRPKLASQYQESAYLPDEDDTLELLYRHGGTAISKMKTKLPARTPESIIVFDPDKHQKELEKSIQWDDCPDELRPQIQRLIVAYWDVFASEGLKNHIRGFTCHIDTGTANPVCCKIPRYGPHESRVIAELARGLEANGLIEEARSPWGAQVVLAAKPNQEHVHWSEYTWRLTVSYRQLNAVTRPFIYPARRCDDAARDIGPSKHFITMDFDSGFWQVLLHPQSRDKTTFFVPGGQKRWTVMPMGCLNAHATFCCLVDTMKREWNAEATARGIRDDIEVTLRGQRPWTDAEVIVDDVMLHSVDKTALIQYFEVVLGVLQHYQVTVKLKKCRFFPQSAEFVGMDVEKDGNRPAKSKMQALLQLKEQTPQGLEDLRKLIGFIGFYQDWIDNFEIRITRWRKHIKEIKANEAKGIDTTLASLWTPEDTTTMHALLDDLIARPVLARPDYTRRFYLKTDWSRLGMAAVLLQADPTDDKATEAEAQEEAGGPCAFDKTTHHLRLRPIAFTSRRCTEQEGTLHSYTGEAATGVWAIEKHQRHLFGREFTWMTDCNGLRQFFEGTDVPTHSHQRMRQRLLRFMFTIVHRPARFLIECDALTRYNRTTEKWRDEPTPTNESTTFWASIPAPTAIAFANHPIEEVGPPQAQRTLLAQKANTARTIWIVNAATTTITEAISDAGLDCTGFNIDDRTQWRQIANTIPSHRHLHTTTEIIEQHHQQEIAHVDWIIAHDGGPTDSEHHDQYNDNLQTLIRIGSHHSLRGIIIFTRRDTTNGNLRECMEETGHHCLKAQVHAHRYGAAIEGEFTMWIATKQRTTLETFHMQQQDAEALTSYLDIDDHPCPDQDTEIHDTQRITLNQGNKGAKVSAMTQRKNPEQQSQEWRTAWTPCYDSQHPGPDLIQQDNQWYDSPFAIESSNATTTTHNIRGIRSHELIRAYGYDTQSSTLLMLNHSEIAIEQIRATPPMQLIRQAITGLLDAENRTVRLGTTYWNDTTDDTETPEQDLEETLHAMLAAELAQTATIPLPTTATWQDATQQDHDLTRVVEALRTNTIPPKATFREKEYHTELVHNRLEHEHGIVFRHETNPRKSVRHLRTRVVPPPLRQAIFAALHTSPMAGHTGFTKTYWKIATRYFWPTMTKDIREMTLGCAHCKVANTTNHEAQQKIQAFESDAPFDVIALDVWHPGRAASIKGSSESHVLVCIDIMTGFVSATFVTAVDSETITKAAFTAFFISHGLPKLIIVDAGNEFAGSLTATCASMGLPFYTVSRGNHKAILCERFHRYLNKVQRIHATNCETFQDFAIGTIFAVYAWNAAPVDGTNITRGYAAIGRDFPFPIDIEREPIVEREAQNQGEQVLTHINAAFPMFHKQQELLKIINDERREYHRDLKNKSRNTKQFQPGELVIVRKQIQTNDHQGPAKARLRARGPYRVLEEIKPGTYKIQRIPSTHGNGRKGRPTKESAARMERIPSPLIIHKPNASIDTRLATYHHAMVDNPLEHTIGLFQHGRFRQANPDCPFAFEKIEDLWQEEIESDSSESSDNDDHSDNDNQSDNEEQDTQYVEQDMTTEPPTVVIEDTDTPDENPRDSINDAPSDQSQQAPTRKRSRTTGPQETPHNLRTHNRTSTRTIQPPKRFRDTEPNPTTINKSTTKIPEEKNRTTSPSDTHTPRQLYSRIKRSRDKLFIIRHHTDDINSFKWFIVQAIPELSDPTEARTEGIYTVRFWIREHCNSKTRTLRNCRYWPEIHERRLNELGPIIPIRPGRAKTLLDTRPERYAAYEQPINLVTEAIIGPFDFAIPNQYNNEANRIAFEEWEEFIARAAEYNVDTSDIDTIIPLR